MLSVKTIRSGIREQEEYYTSDEALETESEKKQDSRVTTNPDILPKKKGAQHRLKTSQDWWR
jgi:hypothetical protein